MKITQIRRKMCQTQPRVKKMILKCLKFNFLFLGWVLNYLVARHIVVFFLKKCKMRQTQPRVKKMILKFLKFNSLFLGWVLNYLVARHIVVFFSQEM